MRAIRVLGCLAAVVGMLALTPVSASATCATKCGVSHYRGIDCFTCCTCCTFADGSIDCVCTTECVPF
jgi:hypothetical protein